MKIYERIVKSTFEPNRNDLWLKPGEGGSITMYEYNGGEWLPIGGSGGSGGSGSGCDCDTSDFIRLSELNVTFPYPTEEGMVYIEDLEGYFIFIEDNNVEKRMNLANLGLLRYIRLTRENGMEDIVLSFDDSKECFESKGGEWGLFPLDPLDPIGISALDIPEGSAGWILGYRGSDQN